jgi:hypothetical protein
MPMKLKQHFWVGWAIGAIVRLLLLGSNYLTKTTISFFGTLLSGLDEPSSLTQNDP